jgi:hypothetical protein
MMNKLQYLLELQILILFHKVPRMKQLISRDLLYQIVWNFIQLLSRLGMDLWQNFMKIESKLTILLNNIWNFYFEFVIFVLIGNW